MNDERTATHQIVTYYLDQDERLLKLLGRMLQEIHRSPQRNLRLEADVMTQMIDCYESLGRFAEADDMKLQIVVVKIDLGIQDGSIDILAIHRRATEAAA